MIRDRLDRIYQVLHPGAPSEDLTKGLTPDDVGDTGVDGDDSVHEVTDGEIPDALPE